MNILAICENKDNRNYYIDFIKTVLPAKFQKQNIDYAYVAMEGIPLQQRLHWLEQKVREEQIDVVIATGKNAVIAMALPDDMKRIVINPILRIAEVGEVGLLDRVFLSAKERAYKRHLEYLACGGYIRKARRLNTYAIFMPYLVSWDQSSLFLAKYDPDRARDMMNSLLNSMVDFEGIDRSAKTAEAKRQAASEVMRRLMMFTDDALRYLFIGQRNT